MEGGNVDVSAARLEQRMPPHRTDTGNQTLELDRVEPPNADPGRDLKRLVA
jgi:hypothetical protein